MPDRPYVPRREPPDMLDRLSSHLMDVVVAFYGITTGALRIADTYSHGLSLTLRAIPDFPARMISVALIAGGVLWIFSILHRFDTVNGYYFSLRTSLTILGIGWLSYFASAVLLRPHAVTIWLLALCFSVGVFGLWGQSFHNEKTTRRRQSEV